MIPLRFASLAIALSVATSGFSTCGGRPEGPSASGDVVVSSAKGTSAPAGEVDVPGVDLSALTPRERREWKTYVGELLSPCSDVPVSIAQCVKEKRNCSKCLPAAKFLVKQVRDGRTREQTVEAYKGRFDADKIRNIDLSDTPTRGPDSAPVVLVEWADFECGHCRLTHPVLDQLIEKFPGKIKFAFKNYPLSFHENAEPAARASIAADAQGKFWGMHQKLFESKSPLKQPILESYAKELGLKVEQFKADMTSDSTTARIAREKKQAEAVGFQGTPFIFINGREFNSKGDFVQDLEDWVRSEIELVDGVAPTPAPISSNHGSSIPQVATSGSAKAPSSAAPSASANK